MSTVLKIRRLSTGDASFQSDLKQLAAFNAAIDALTEQTVKEVVAAIRNQGDAALLDYTRRFDRWSPATAADLVLDADEMQAALKRIDGGLTKALQTAADRIQRFHQAQLDNFGTGFQYQEADGTVLGARNTPIDRAGLYVPGGLASYPSSLLMSAVTAKVAGVKEVVMVSPTPDGKVNNVVLAAAAIAGVDRVVRIGGAQAIAALAHGTATVPRVDKITGPGNKFVAEAKRQVFGQVGIDMVAGPSEIAIIADGTTNPDWVAMDLFSQAEHDEVAQSILLSTNAAYLQAVEAAMQRLVQTQPRKSIIEKSIGARGALIHVASLAEACEVVNYLAPEHLELSVEDSESLLPLIRHAGAIFCGPYASESLGDYVAGPNHVLPTARTARFSSPLGVYDFMKRTSIIKASAATARELGKVAATIAHAEGLTAHANAAELRI
jgi:histidinol dehydrogenase